MASITSTFETLKRTADSITTKFETIRSNISSEVGIYTGTFGNEILNGSMTGVNYAGLGEVNTAIETWLTTIETDLAKLEAVDATGAFKGEQFLAAIDSFILAVRETCYNLSSNLREFQTIMNQAIEKYRARDEQLKTAIGGTADKVKSEASLYEKVEHQS